MNKVGLTADIHIDYNRLSIEKYIQIIKDMKLDYLVIAGDISNDLDMTLDFLTKLSRVVSVRAVMGNHDYYTFANKESMIDKLKKFRDSGFALDTNPLILDSAIILGNGGWHDDTVYSGKEGKYNYKHDDIEYSKLKYSCSPEEYAKLLEIDLNNQIIRAKRDYGNKIIIPVSHIAPHKSLVYGRDKKISNIFGCSYLHELYKKHGIKKAFYGHTHVDNNGIEIEGITYFTAQLKYDFEWAGGLQIPNTIKVLEV